MTARMMESQGDRPTRHAHRLVAETAAALAAELYDTVMSNNLVRAEWQRQNPDRTEKQLLDLFVRKNTGKCLSAARATLALQLRSSIDDNLKQEILKALSLDATLMRGRTQ